MRQQFGPLLITGATGTLGQAFGRICELRGLEYRLTSRQELDIADVSSVETALEAMRPWAVINTAGYVRVDDAEADVERCRRENSDGPATLAVACAGRGIPLVTFSTDLVFDGSKRSPYTEADPVSPLNVYGRTKAEAEERVLAACPQALIVRTSAFFGPWDRFNFLAAVLGSLARGERFVAADDMVVSPTYVPELVNVSLDLLIDGERGLWHLANPGAVTWAAFARLAAQVAGLDTGLIDGRPAASLGLSAPRPAYSPLASDRGVLLQPIERAVENYLSQLG